MNEQVYIVGAGAIGKTLATLLKANGKDVALIRASTDNRENEMLSLSVDIANESAINARVSVSTFSEMDAPFTGIIVIANKSVGNVAVADTLYKKAKDASIVVMQNGLNVEHSFLEKAFPNVYRCVLFATSQHITPHMLRFRPVSASPIGVIRGDASRLQKLVSILDTKLFQFSATSDIQPIIWEKVIANCVFNSICPLLEADNGVFYRNEAARSLAVDVITECAGVAQRAGIAIDKDTVLKTVLRISEASEGQLISTLQDIMNKCPTEIESLNFAIVKMVATQSPSLQVTKTQLLGELTKLKSDLNLNR
jgi:2-dehydropantoate 2-reductase